MPASVLAALGLAILVACGQAPSTGEVVVRADFDSVEFPAVVTAADFVGGDEMSGYHFLVWQGGGAAHQSLLKARVTDVQVLAAFDELGARPGNALTIDTWDERYDPDSAAPDRVIVGPPVRIEILVPGGDRPLSVEDILEDPGGEGFAMRYGGHRDNIPRWHSGCIVCLFSCPGSKVGNAAYTVRDFVQGATRFRPRPGALPADGTEVIVRLTLE